MTNNHVGCVGRNALESRLVNLARRLTLRIALAALALALVIVATAVAIERRRPRGYSLVLWSDPKVDYRAAQADGIKVSAILQAKDPEIVDRNITLDFDFPDGRRVTIAVRLVEFEPGRLGCLIS